jgi:hypothetical protein
VLGTEALENGPNEIMRESGAVISKAARRQMASLGINRLETIPTCTAAVLFINEPICYIQLPTKASPYSPITRPPVARVDKRLLQAMVMVITTREARYIRARPANRLGMV